jgi:hypothetical protein
MSRFDDYDTNRSPKLRSDLALLWQIFEGLEIFEIPEKRIA